MPERLEDKCRGVPWKERRGRVAGCTVGRVSGLSLCRFGEAPRSKPKRGTTAAMRGNGAIQAEIPIPPFRYPVRRESSSRLALNRGSRANPHSAIPAGGTRPDGRDGAETVGSRTRTFCAHRRWPGTRGPWASGSGCVSSPPALDGLFSQWTALSRSQAQCSLPFCASERTRAPLPRKPAEWLEWAAHRRTGRLPDPFGHRSRMHGRLQPANRVVSAARRVQPE